MPFRLTFRKPVSVAEETTSARVRGREHGVVDDPFCPGRLARDASTRGVHRPVELFRVTVDFHAGMTSTVAPSVSTQYPRTHVSRLL